MCVGVQVLDEFAALQDTADPVPWSEIAPLLDSRTPGGQAAAFAQVDTTCLNAASIAQVHRATRTDGSRVVLKLLRPNVQKTFDHDMGQFLSLVGMYEGATGTPST